jgi:hypothetical protein
MTGPYQGRTGAATEQKPIMTGPYQGWVGAATGARRSRRPKLNTWSARNSLRAL